MIDSQRMLRPYRIIAAFRGRSGMTISIRSLLSGPLCPTTRIIRPLSANSVAIASSTCSNFRPMPSQKESGSALQVVDVIDRQIVRRGENQSALAFTARCDGAHFGGAQQIGAKPGRNLPDRETRRTPAPRVAPRSAVPAATSPCNSRPKAGRSAFQQSARTRPSAAAVWRAAQGGPKSALLRAGAPRPLNSSPPHRCRAVRCY